MTEILKPSSRKKPKILVSDTDLARLTSLAEAIADRSPDLADELLGELERAKVVKASAIADDVVRMGSAVTYEADDGQQREVTLVFPGEADISQGRVSILTPIGTALLGLSPGQSMEWIARDGHRHSLKVLAVGPAQPVAAA
jgi:regulator of nucleoside diphosphate kinase